ncbi:MAG: hypothetical protein U9Q06_02980 [Nanoarchaeota archaeon]|nr:hypothetical protein [Nanoarchaeota archaeon]
MKSRFNKDLSWRSHVEFSKWLRNEFGNSPKYHIATSLITFPCRDNQQELFPDTKERFYQQGIGGYAATFFEYLAGAMVGGMLHKGKVMELKGLDLTIQPDIANHRDREYLEVKSSAKTEQLKLIREQIEKMGQWQLYNQGKIPKLDFMFIRHKVHKMKARGLTQEEFLEEVRKSILYAAQVPFAIPLQFYLDSDATKPYYHKEYYYPEAVENNPYRGYAQKHTSSISSKFLNHLIENPQETIREIGLEPSDFEFEKRKVQGIKINGKRIYWFPCLTVKHKNYQEWVDQSRGKIKEKLLGELKSADLEELPLFSSADLPIGEIDYLPETPEEINKFKANFPKFPQEEVEEESGFPWEEEEDEFPF